MIKQILTAATLLAILLVPMAASGKGRPDSAILLKDANGVEIGRVIGMGTVSWPYVLTKEGYRALFRVGKGMLYRDDISEANTYYESTDCKGQAYTRLRFPGTVFIAGSDDTGAYATGAIFYSPHDAQPVTINVNSRLGGNPISCLPEISTREVYPAYPNDPAVTGIANTAYPTRMLIE